MEDSEKKPRFRAGFAIYGGLDSNIYTLFAVRVINRFGDFVQLLLVLILTGKLGMGSREAGAFVTVVLVCTSLGQLTGGSVSDRLPRKWVLGFCQGTVSLCYLACFVLVERNLTQIVPLLILLGSPFRGATGPVSNAMVADFAAPEDRSKAFSLLYLGTNVGVALGPIAASFFYARSLPLLFGFSAALIGASTVVLLAHTPSVSPAPRGEGTDSTRPESLLKVLRGIPPILWFLLLFVLYSFAYGQNTFALPLQCAALFGEEGGAVRFGYLMTANAVTVLLLTPLATRLTGHRHQLQNMALAMGFFVAGFSFYAFCVQFFSFLLATVVWTVGEILVATNANVYLNAYAPHRYRGRFNALSITAGGLGSSLGPLLGGHLLSGSGYRTLWLFVGGLCLSLLFCFLLLHDRFERAADWGGSKFQGKSN